MAGIIFSEGSGLNGSIYGNCQAPIQLFVEQYDEECEKESALKYLFKMGTSENFGDMFSGMTAMDGFNPVGENGAYPEDSMQVGFEKFMAYVEWKDRFRISKAMIEDGKIMDMAAQPRQFVTAYHRTRENFGASIYGKAIAGQSTMKFRGMNFDIAGADKLCVFHTAHPSKVKDTMKQSNKFADTFSRDALNYAESAMHLFKGDNGEIQGVAPDTIVIPDIPDLKDEVFAAVASENTCNVINKFNYQYGRWNVLIWPYLNQFITAGTKPWILLDSKYNENFAGAVWNDRINLEVHSFVDENTDANVWNGRARFNATFNNWRAVAVGGVTGGTQLIAA